MRTQSLFSSLLGLNAVSVQAFDCTPSSFNAILPSNATVNFASSVAAYASFNYTSLEFPANDTGLPALCAVSVNVVSSPNSSFNFGLFLPETWNNRYLASGNGGFGGGINWNDMESNVLAGFAAVSTDTGHLSDVFNASWALNQPESIIDWAYRAMHESVVMGKVITEAYYDNKIKYSYYAACSTGGRQGLKEIQKYPEDFDGVLAGAPAWWTSHLQPWSLEAGLWNLPVDAPTHIPGALFPVIGAEVLKQCDPQDGLTDSIIQDPYGCNFYPEALLCTSPTNQSNCLTGPQLQTLEKFYKDWTDTNNTFVFPSYPLGAEAQYTFILDTDSGAPTSAGTTWVSNFVLNITDSPSIDWLSEFTYSTVQLGDSINPGTANADDFDLSPFAARGGKLIHYHGLSDGLIPTSSSIYFHQRVLSTLIPLGVNVPDFYKFYLVPGMQHCQGSVNDAPWYIAGGNQPFALGAATTGVPGFNDARHDAMLALMQWVEQGVAPEEIVAT
ncbi:putative feruloyl esterase B-1, partial [Lachnellula suecica]